MKLKRLVLALLPAVAFSSFALGLPQAVTPGATVPVPAIPGAPANTQRVSTGVTSVAGSNSVTIYLSFSQADVGKNIVISGLGSGVAQASAVSSGGTGNAYGDLLTLSVPACTTAPVLKVTAVAAGAVMAAVPWTPGVCPAALASLPSTAVSVASTTGSGSGSTFILTWGALPLQTTISAVSGYTLTLAAPSQQTLSNVSKYLAWGNDDAPAINAALASGSTAVALSAGSTYGIFSPLLLPTASRTNFQCNGATIAALAPMAEMVMEAQGSGFYSTEGSVVSGCRLDGMGVAQLNASHNQFDWTWRDNMFMNAVAGNLYVGGQGEDSKFLANHYGNDLGVVGAYPQYNVSVNYTDNHFTDEIAYGAVNNFVDNSGGNFYNFAHGYYQLAEAFVFNGPFIASNLYADSISSYVAGIRIAGTNGYLNGWTTNTVSGTGQMGVFIVNSAGKNVVINGAAGSSAISSANMVVTGWACCIATSNYVMNNDGASYQSTGNGDGSIVFGLGASASAASAIVMGDYSSSSAQGSPAIGYSNKTTSIGSAALGRSAWDNGVQQFVYAPSTSYGQGKAELGIAVLSATITGATATRLTADAAAASSSNCADLFYAWQAENIDVRLVATDETSAKQYGATWTGHLYTRSAGVSSVLVDGVTTTIAPDATRSNGTWTGASASISADTTNGCLNVSFTPPTGNSDTLHVVATVTGPQAQ